MLSIGEPTLKTSIVICVTVALISADQSCAFALPFAFPIASLLSLFDSAYVATVAIKKNI